MSLFFSLIKPLVYLSLPALLIRTVSNSSPTGRYYVRVGLYIGTLTAVAAWGVVVAAAMSIVGRRFDVNYVVARSFYAIASRVLDIRVEIEGEDYMKTRPAVYMSNHQSMVDVLMLGRSVRRSDHVFR
jgi:lysophosphatidate acyltransferase